MTVEERLALSAQTWLHGYLVATLLREDGDRRLCDLAAWMRAYSGSVVGPDCLHTLSETTWARLWRGGFPSSVGRLPVQAVVRALVEMKHLYDDTSLLVEIRSKGGIKARIATRTLDGIKTPALETEVSLSRTNLDFCFSVFKVFLTWPQPKDMARACFTNADSVLSEGDVVSVRIFYRGDERQLTFAVERPAKEWSDRWKLEAVLSGFTPEDVVALDSVDELLEWAT